MAVVGVGRGVVDHAVSHQPECVKLGKTVAVERSPSQISDGAVLSSQRGVLHSANRAQTRSTEQIETGREVVLMERKCIGDAHRPEMPVGGAQNS